MPMAITTLLALVVALCLQDTLVLSVVLEAEYLHTRTSWGVNDIQLVCREGELEGPLQNAIFTRNGVSISANNDEHCSPGGVTYCAEEQGSRLRFVASNVTEGIFACKNNVNVESNKIAIIGKRVV